VVIIKSIHLNLVLKYTEYTTYQIFHINGKNINVIEALRLTASE